jgi:CelD/BcsL family acetyltransferase involved in cellulose biosynthesis
VTLRGCVAAAWIFAIARVKRVIKQNPALWDAAYKVRAFIGPMRKRLRR